MNKSSGAGQTRSNFYNSHDDAEIFLYHKKKRKPTRALETTTSATTTSRTLWCNDKKIFPAAFISCWIFLILISSHSKNVEKFFVQFIFSCCIIGKSNFHAELEQKALFACFYNYIPISSCSACLFESFNVKDATQRRCWDLCEDFTLFTTRELRKAKLICREFHLISQWRNYKKLSRLEIELNGENILGVPKLEMGKKAS